MPFVRALLVLFVLAWVFDLVGVRGVVPLWVPFALALGLELHLFVAGWRAQPRAGGRRGRPPQEADRDLGYEGEELLLVRDGERELWVPYSGESEEELEALVTAARERDEAVRRPAPVRRAPPFGRLLAGVALIAALAGAVWLYDHFSGWNGLTPDVQAAATDRFSDEASRIVGRRVAIRCDEAGEHVGVIQHADGAAVVGGRVAYLTPERCHDLYRLAFKADWSPSRTGRAIAVLAHEAWHLRGERDEGRTECFALQSGVELGERLGLRREDAQRLMRQQLAENALRGRGAVEYLVPPGCRAGGELDLFPEREGFP